MRAVPCGPTEHTIHQQSPCNAINPGSGTYTSCLRPGECFSLRYVTFRWPYTLVTQIGVQYGCL